ncbi:DNA polymerase family A [compost metagenome]
MSLYARIPQWQMETARFMEKNGFTLTAFGTKRHATEDIFSKDGGKVARQHRQGTNATIQGSAACMLRIVLTLIVERGLLDRLDMVFFAPIYDEVVAWVHRDDVAEYCREMDEIMRSATPPGHAVAQVPEFSVGPDWGRVHELGRYPGDDAINAAVARAVEEGREMWETDMAMSFEDVYGVSVEKEAA